ECGVNFIATKGADFQGALMGLGAFKVKMLFSKARRKKPCIIFIDEFDSIGEKRSYQGSGIDKENNRIITTLLNEMDGFSSLNGVVVIAATNSYQSLDAALVRPGRFDLKYTISNPDKDTRGELIDIYTKGKPLAPELTRDMLVNAFNGLSCAAIESILNEAISLMIQTEQKAIDARLINQAAIRIREKLK
ncbi:AAA family ATPase, partial [Bullifex porci]